MPTKFKKKRRKPKKGGSSEGSSDNDFGYKGKENDLFKDSKAEAKGINTKIGRMSSRLQIKFLMQKTMQEADWDMDNDSELKGGSGKY